MKPLLLVCAMFYLTFHVMHGERGVYALFKAQRQLASLHQELAETKAERERVELRVSHLRDNSLDLDLLDEQMRRMMGVMKADEVVFITPTKG